MSRILVCTAVFLALAASARADSTSALALSPSAPDLCPAAPVGKESDRNYRVAITDAVVDHDEGRFAEAKAQFRRAHELSPSARTLRGLGMVEFELRNYPESVHYLDSALSCNVRPLSGELRQETEQLLSRARAYVGTVELSGLPADASVRVDGELLASGERVTLLLTAGKHELELAAPGFRSQTRALNIAGGELRALPLTLSLVAPAAGPQASTPLALQIRSTDAPAPTQPAETRLVRKWWLWTLVGAVVVGGAVGIALSAHARSSSEGPPVSTKYQGDSGSTIHALWQVP